MKILKLNHSTYQHQYHIVWGTKWRRKILKTYVVEYLSKLLKDVEEKYQTIEIVSHNTDEDHIHLQIIIPPDEKVSEVVKYIKTYTSQRLKKRFKFIRNIYMKAKGMWSVGYFSSTIGLNEETIRKYIEDQGKKDIPQQQTFF